MTFQPQLSQEDLAKFADENGLQCLKDLGEKEDILGISPILAVRLGVKIKLRPGALTEFGLKPLMQPHNPDGLTADVITEGGKYRAMMKGEITNKDSMAWDKESQRWITMELINGLELDDSQFMATSYRTAVSTPFPKPVPAPEESSAAQSDTPRTDEVEGQHGAYNASAFSILSRCLERKLTAALSQRDGLQNKWECAVEIAAQAQVQRDEARRLLANAKWLLAETREKLAALVAASDGVSIEGIDLQDTCATLKQITEYLK